MRRIGASILVVLAAVMLLLSSFGWWANRYFLDSERFSEKANQILDQESVQQALAVAVTDQISEASGRDLQIARPFITTIVREVVQSDPFQRVFDTAILRLHRAIVEGGARDAVLDLSATVDRVKRALEPIAPNLADEIPDGERVRVRLLDETQLQTIYDATNLIEKVVVGLTIATIVLFAGGIALSNRRWRTAALGGWVVLGLFLSSMVLVRAGRAVTGGLAERDEYSSAAQDAYKAITRGLMVQGIVFAILGLVVALSCGWTDRHGGWAAVREAFARAGAWLKAQVPKKVPAPTPEPALTAAAEAAGGGAPAMEAAEAPEAAPAVAYAAPVGARATIEGVLAPRLPEPPRKVRAAHWWRALGLLVLGLFAIFTPGSLTTVVVVLLGVGALYLALTEALAAWASPREPTEPEEPANQAAPTVTVADAPEPDEA